MHTDVNGADQRDGSTAIVNSAQARGVPVITAQQMLDWLDGRNGSSFQSIAWNGNVLSFNIAVGAGANGLRALVPAAAGAGPITGITLNGASVPFTTQTIKGVSYAAFAAGAGAYQVAYGADIVPPAISAVSVAPGSDDRRRWRGRRTSLRHRRSATAPARRRSARASATPCS